MKQKNNIFERNTQNNKITRLLTLVVILVTVIIFVLIVIGLYKTNIIEIPAFIREMFSPSKSSEYTMKNYDDKNFIEFIQKDSSSNADNSVIYIDVELQDFSQIIASAPYITEYSLTQNINYYDESHRRIIYKNKIWVKDDKYLIEIYDYTDILIKYILCDGKNIYIKDINSYDEPNEKVYPMSEEFTLENQAGLIDIRRLLNTDDISELVIDLVREDKTNIYMMTYQHSDIPELTEQIVVSVDHGIIEEAEMFYDGELIYRMVVSGKINAGSVSDDVFILE